MSAPSTTLATRTVSGALWSGVSRFGQQGLTLVSTSLLAHLLPPAAYGLVGMATIATGFVSLFTELGMTSAIIRRPEVCDEFLSSIFWVNLLLGACAWGLLVAVAHLIGAFYHESQLTPILRMMALGFILSGAASVHYAVLTRRLEFRRLATVELISCVVSSSVAVTFALLGFGVWSLVYASLSNAATRLSLVWLVCEWRPQLVFRWSSVRSIASYSLNLSGFGIFNYFSRNADNLIVGRYLGAAQLGYYQLAYNLMIYPVQSVTSVLRVLFPAFSNLQNDNVRFRAAYLRVVQIVAVVCFPLMVGLLLTADTVVPVMLGIKWMPAVPILMVLCPIGLIQSVGTLVGHIYTAKGRADWMMYWGIVFGCLTICGFLIGVRWGALGVAVSYAVVNLLLVYPDVAIPFRLIKLAPFEYWQVLRAPVGYCMVMAVGVWRSGWFLCGSASLIRWRP